MANTRNDPPDNNTPSEQLAIMKQMLALAEQQTALSKERSSKSEYRTQLSEDRSRMSAERSKMSADRSKMSAARSEMSEARSYHNAERTLSVWIRTAMSLMIFGIAIDRFGILLHQLPIAKEAALFHSTSLHAVSAWTGAALVMLAVFMSASAGARFFAYALKWRQQHKLPFYHGPYLASFFALMVTIFGLALLSFMLFFAD